MGGDVTGKRHSALRRHGADHTDQLLIVHYPSKKTVISFSVLLQNQLRRHRMSKDDRVKEEI